MEALGFRAMSEFKEKSIKYQTRELLAEELAMVHMSLKAPLLIQPSKTA